MRLVCWPVGALCELKYTSVVSWEIKSHFMIRKRRLRLSLETRGLWVRRDRENNLPLRPQLTPPIIQKKLAVNPGDLRLGENSK